jgi:hypothetical protein
MLLFAGEDGVQELLKILQKYVKLSGGVAQDCLVL